MKVIKIADDFSEFPALRHCNISEKSGEEFYHNVLNEAFKKVYEKGDKLTINLDDTAGYASSFLDEAFGNLVFDFTLDVVKKHINIISIQEPHWKEMIESETFKQWEERRNKQQNPKVTATHAAWFRLRDNSIQQKIWEQPEVV
ncbi:DUF4325 domain-containing protein [bacterium]|nr:MAG: DUF4325 domain-containing protein [bacterium]